MNKEKIGNDKLIDELAEVLLEETKKQSFDMLNSVLTTIGNNKLIKGRLSSEEIGELKKLIINELLRKFFNKQVEEEK